MDVDLQTQAPRQPEEFRVDLDLFEGPLDLLLFLIHKNELDLTELSLTKITGQYLAYIDLFQTLNISIVGDYLVHAATLIELKSAYLLPQPQPEEATEEESAVQELLRQLRERAQLKELAEGLEALQIESSLRWLRETAPPSPELEVFIDASPLELCYVLEQMLRSVRSAPVHEVQLEEWSVPQKMQRLHRDLQELRRVDLTEVLLGCSSRSEKVATFIAALELAKQILALKVMQSSSFGNIELVLEES